MFFHVIVPLMMSFSGSSVTAMNQANSSISNEIVEVEEDKEQETENLDTTLLSSLGIVGVGAVGGVMVYNNNKKEKNVPSKEINNEKEENKYPEI